MRARKRAIIDMIGALLDHGQELSLGGLDRLIRRAVDRAVPADPTLAIDHLRRGLVEVGLLVREPGSATYRRGEKPGILEVHREELARWEKLIGSSPSEYFECAFCGEERKPAAQLNHYLKRHSLRGEFERAVREFGSPELRSNILGGA